MQVGSEALAQVLAAAPVRMQPPEKAPGGAGAARGSPVAQQTPPPISQPGKGTDLSTREGKMDRREGAWCRNYITGNEIHLPGRWSRVCLRA